MPTPLLDNRQLGTDVQRPNLLTNGGFEIWQRGNGPFSANGMCTADRWFLTTGGSSTMAVNPIAGEIPNTLAGQITYTHAGGISALFQKLITGSEHAQLKGKQVSFSARVLSNIPNAIRLNFAGAVGTNASPYHPGGGTWQTLTVTDTVGTGGEFHIRFECAASSTFWVDNAMLVVGSQPCDYVPLHPADDLARCMRYYEVFNVGNGAGIATGLSMLAGTAIAGFNWRVQKAVAPTVTFAGPWSVTINGGTQLSGASMGMNSQNALGGQLVANVAGQTGGQACFIGSNGAGTLMAAEANP